jgi:hypothetical protein
MSIQNKTFLVLLFSLIFYSFTFSQDKVDVKQSQEYRYKDSFIELKFSSDKINYSYYDDVKIELEIRNLSKKPVFLFPTAYFDTIKSSDKYIYDIGGEFIAYIDHDVKMKKLEAGKTYLYKYKFIISKLYTNIHLSFGYIPTKDWIETFIKHSKNEYKCFIYKDDLTISSFLVELFTRRITGGNLWIYLKKD